MKALLVAVLLLYVSDRSFAQYSCVNPNRPDVRYNVGDTFTKQKRFQGARGQLTGTYNCECRQYGRSVCTAVDIPCYDAKLKIYRDLNERFDTTYGGREMTCTCKRGRMQFVNCVSTRTTVPQTQKTCRDYKGRTNIRPGERYIPMTPTGRLYSCECGTNGRLVSGSCSVYSGDLESSSTTCQDHISGANVRVGAMHVVQSVGRLFNCECGNDGRPVIGTCTRYTGTTSRPVQPTQTSRVVAPSNPCQSDSHNCGENSQCIYRGRGQHDCRCNPGYRSLNRRAFNCTDIDECSASFSYVRRRLCGENAACVNSPGSYSCQCEEGFSGDGHTCVIMDQCTENLYQCDMNARCMSSATSFQCVCLEGYEGDGRACTEVDPCSQENECHANADCIRTSSSYTCVCSDGYAGDGRRCSKMCRDDVSGQLVENGEPFLRTNAISDAQEACTCGDDGDALPGSCLGELTTTEATTTTTTTTEATTTTTPRTRRPITCYRHRHGHIPVGTSYERPIRGITYRCTCKERNGRGVTSCGKAVV